MQNMLFSGVSRPSRFLNDLYFTTCFKSYYRAAVVKYSRYLVLSGGPFLKKSQTFTTRLINS